MNKGELFCKYCLEKEEIDNPIINPCNCSDGVHLNCLTIWLTYSKHKENQQYMCEICLQDYDVINNDIIINIPQPPPPSHTPSHTPPPPPPPPPPSHTPPPPPPPPSHTPPPPSHTTQSLQEIFEPRTQNVYSITNNRVYPTRNHVGPPRIHVHRRSCLCENCDTKETLFYTGSIVFGISTISFTIIK